MWLEASKWPLLSTPYSMVASRPLDFYSQLAWWPVDLCVFMDLPEQCSSKPCLGVSACMHGGWQVFGCLLTLSNLDCHQHNPGILRCPPCLWPQYSSQRSQPKSNQDTLVYLWNLWVWEWVGFFLVPYLDSFLSVSFVYFWYLTPNILFYYPVEECLFSNETQKGCGSRWVWRWGRVDGGKTIIRVYYVRKFLFSIKGK